MRLGTTLAVAKRPALASPTLTTATRSRFALHLLAQEEPCDPGLKESLGRARQTLAPANLRSWTSPGNRQALNIREAWGSAS